MPGKKYLAQRAVAVEASIRTRMLELASTMKNVIALGRGDPDFDTPATVVQAGVRALEQGLHHYTAPAGLLELRAAICEGPLREKGLDYSPRQVVVCNGCQEALFISLLALVDPGDEVILQAPRFNAFDHMVNLAGGRLVTVATNEEHDFALRADDIRRAITEKTKLLVVANPNNPTGALIGQDELREIAALAVQNDLLVISDEVYDRIVFDNGTLFADEGNQHVRITRLSPEPLIHEALRRMGRFIQGLSAGHDSTKDAPTTSC
jgi:aminotransferase